MSQGQTSYEKKNMTALEITKNALKMYRHNNFHFCFVAHLAFLQIENWFSQAIVLSQPPKPNWKKFNKAYRQPDVISSV